MHLYQEFAPHPLLAAHVACLWTSRALPQASGPVRFLPGAARALFDAPLYVLQDAHAALRGLATRDVDWTRLAADCGYYDQSHLIHAFRQFADDTPASFHFSNTPA